MSRCRCPSASHGEEFLLPVPSLQVVRLLHPVVLESEYTPVRSFLTLAKHWNAECYVDAHATAHRDAERLGQ